ncbi:hypothetical protein D9M68_100060 [compost metagenome]
MTIITSEQRAFLDHHRIPLSRVFDAKGMKRAEYQEAMRGLDMVIAVGTSACKAAGHRMRTRAGHCAQCEPATLAFMLRNDDPGFVYIAAPLSGDVVKVGSSQDPAQRMKTLNSLAYGGYRDWRLHFSEPCERAGFVEFNAHRMMRPYSTPGVYVRGTVQVACSELFACELSDAIAIVKTAIANRVVDSTHGAQADVKPRTARAPRQAPPSTTAEKAPAAQATRPFPQADDSAIPDGLPVAPPGPKTWRDYLSPWAVWILPAITLFVANGSFWDRVGMAVGVLFLQPAIGIIFLIVLTAVLRASRGSGK